MAFPQLLLSDNSMDLAPINVIWGPLLMRPSGEVRPQDLPANPIAAGEAVKRQGVLHWCPMRHASMYHHMVLEPCLPQLLPRRSRYTR